MYTLGVVQLLFTVLSDHDAYHAAFAAACFASAAAINTMKE